MFLSILKITIILSYLFDSESRPLTDIGCKTTLLGCSCLNLENITDVEVEPCCTKMSETLSIMGNLVKNISINVEKSRCANSFINLLISDTGIVKFNSPLKGLNNVSYVTIERNQNLSDFNKLVFKEISQNIQSIFVEFNSFRTITKKTFANLTKLNTLRLSDNKIGYIEDRSFSDLKSLNSLYINGNILTLLNSEVFIGLDSLKVLSLLNNPLQEPKSVDLFKHLKSLRHLMMSHGTGMELAGIGQLPQRIFFSVKQLRTLNMTNIRINNLTDLTFYGLNELESLDLQVNRITVIPPGTLQQVPKIKSIYLSKNQITCLFPDTFQNLPRLNILDISQNEISYISDDVFKDLGQLQTLDLSENNIYVIERNAFVGLRLLMILKLNVIHGRAKNEIQTKFESSSLAKLRDTTKIIGLEQYFGITKGQNQPEIVRNGSERQRNTCPIASVSDKDWVDSNTTGSRKYLLIIVGICVVFLLIAFAIIMTYRAWSKRRMGEIELAEDRDEKQEMLHNKACIVNGRLDKPVSKSNHHTRKSINGGSGYDQSGDPNLQMPQRQISITVKPSTLQSDGRSHSDDESALTPLGVL